MKLLKVVTATLAGLMTVSAYATPIYTESTRTAVEPPMLQSERLFDTGYELPSFMELASAEIRQPTVRSEDLIDTGFMLVDNGDSDHYLTALYQLSVVCVVDSQISASGCQPGDGTRSVPEPGTLLLLGTGLLLLSLSTRNRRREI